MLYYLFDFLENVFDLPGASVFQYISFRAALAIVTVINYYNDYLVKKSLISC